jgi:anthranilate synthase component 1
MTTYPAKNNFNKVYNAKQSQVVWTELVADLETPVSAMIKLSKNQSYSFLLESVEGGDVRGRYSVLGIEPDLIWRCFGDDCELGSVKKNNNYEYKKCSQSSLDSLASLIKDSEIDLPNEVPPSAVGLFGYMGYDMVRLMENIPDRNPDVLGIPDSIFIRPKVTAVFDNVTDKMTVVTPVWYSKKRNSEDAYRDAKSRLENVINKLKSSITGQLFKSEFFPDQISPTSNTTQEEYCSMVEKAKEYIRAGEIFQVVPSQRFTVPLSSSPMSLYRSLRRLNPSPFLFIVNMNDFSLVGSSPEILVRLRGNEVTIRPIAGTRPRGTNKEEDNALAEDLLADPKERAEHLMLLDLGRNDVGRVSEIGSVKVTESYSIEKYSHVMHIVSNVKGKAKTTVNSLKALIAGFPAGTVTGAPKIRAMEIIDELENEKRSFYAGAIGYFGANGEMDTCITLRTALIQNGQMYVQAGGGVVADSNPESEYQESNNKAKALLHAAADSLRYSSNKDC